jgi:hypothetical protein
MKVSELNLENVSYTMSANTYSARRHYKFTMKLGRVFPTTKEQAKFFISQGICLDVLNSTDVQIVESMLNKHGFFGDYKYTKSKTWVRLENGQDLHVALKKEFSL